MRVQLPLLGLRGEVLLTVADTQNGTVKTYRNPINTAFAPIQDTAAFATCP